MRNIDVRKRGEEVKVDWIACVPHSPPPVSLSPFSTVNSFSYLILNALSVNRQGHVMAKHLSCSFRVMYKSDAALFISRVAHFLRRGSGAGRESGGWLKRQNFCSIGEIHKNVIPTYDNESYTDLKQEILWYLWILGTEDFYSYIGRIPPLGILYTLKEVPQEFFHVSS